MGNKFAEKIKSLFGKGKKINDDFYDDLTDLLVERISDLDLNGFRTWT